MNYVLGSDAEAMAFTEAGIEYQPDGLRHAVDTESPTNPAQAILAYALCGTAVRVWPNQPFDPDAARVHDQCAALTHPD